MLQINIILVRATAMAAIILAGFGAFGVASDAPVAARSSAVNRSAITFRIYDYAHQNRKSLLAAEAETTRILADAGVTSHWVDCPTTHAELPDFPDCQSAPGSSDFTLALLSNAMVDPHAGSQDVLGNAYDAGQDAHMAHVFYDRVRDLAGGGTASFEALLGLVMAHEIGHLLLGQAHSRTGIMKASWSAHELGRGACAEMVFTSVQSRRMKARIAAMP